MGIDYSGGMIVGRKGSDISNAFLANPDFDIVDFVEDNDLERYAPYYDADTDYCIIGYPVDDVEVENINNEWLSEIRNKGDKFRTLTGLGATLFGCQDIY